MPARTKKQSQESAAAARESKKDLPADHFKKKAAQRKSKMGPVSRNEVYPQQVLMDLCGWGRLAWRKAVDSGLESYPHGSITYVTGEAYYAWVSSQAKSNIRSK